jgi:hypothetical protein
MDSASPSAALRNPDMALALACELFESSNSRNAIDRDRDFAGSGSLSAALSPAPRAGVAGTQIGLGVAGRLPFPYVPHS